MARPPERDVAGRAAVREDTEETDGPSAVSMRSVDRPLGLLPSVELLFFSWTYPGYRAEVYDVAQVLRR